MHASTLSQTEQLIHPIARCFACSDALSRWLAARSFSLPQARSSGAAAAASLVGD